jgi:tRNA-2-methylthio-N6-dimethylallyladenosine synthase
MSKTYYIKTYGCQQNKSDSERLAGDYQARGWQEVDSWKEADQIVINTCAIRQSAEDRVRGFLNNVENHFAGKKRPKLIITGCMTHHGEQKLRELLPLIDEILPVGEVGFNQEAIRHDKHHAWIPISEGCNSFCSYCIVPYSRGRERSRPMADIINEVNKLADQGYTEITLLGQNVNSWGLEKVGIGLRKMLMNKDHELRLEDLPSNQSQYLSPGKTPPFVTLLQKVSKVSGIKLIRFMTSNPWDFHDELIAEIASNNKIDRFIHLPIQSGSNRILKLMNRGYTKEDYLSVVNKLRAKIPNVELGTDLIVGFPTESEADHQETLSLAKEVNWKVAFVARYSPRPGTVSWRLYEDDVSAADKKRRWEELDQIINKDNLAIRPKVIK